jgi:hypothetical protein
MEDSHDSWSTRKPDRSPQKAVQGCHTLVPAQAACQRSRIVVRVTLVKVLVNTASSLTSHNMHK